MPVTALIGHYTPLANPDDVFTKEWAACETSMFEPNARQTLLMQAVAIALDEGLFYNRDVDARVAQLLQATPEQLAAQSRRVRVEGGDFGCDVYMARKAVEAQRSRLRETALAQKLQLHVGENLGRLVFQGKVDSAVTVQEILPHGRFTLTSTRGRNRMRISTTATGISEAMDGAAARQARPTNFEQFLQLRAQPAPAADLFAPGEHEEAEQAAPAPRG